MTPTKEAYKTCKTANYPRTRTCFSAFMLFIQLLILLLLHYTLLLKSNSSMLLHA